MSAALLAIWYCMSIIGFDVHTCMSSGRTFVTAFTESLACADIHPEHHCCADSCCSSEKHEESVGAKSCCSNDYQVIQLSGYRTNDDSEDKYSFSKVSFPCVADVPVRYVAMAKYHAEHIQFLEPDSGVLPPGDLCATFGVWRI